MAGKGDYAENKVLELLVGKTAFATPTAYIALYTAAPSDSGGGTEVSGNNYSRKQTAGSDWGAAASGSIANSTTLTFATPSNAWGTVTHFALFDNSTGGNLLYWGPLSVSKTIGQGDVASFAVGSLVITED